jgi:hypothetical protein
MNRKLVLDDLTKLRIEDGLVLAGVGFALVNNVAPIELVLQHQVECPAGEMLAAGQPSAGSFTALGHNTQSIEFGPEQRDRAKLGVALEDHPDSRRLGFADDQLPFPDVVAERHIAAHPHALLLRRGDLVANALARDLALELGEREQHVDAGQTGSWRPCGTAIPRAWRVSFPEPSSSLQDDREGPLTLCPSGAPLPLRLWRPTLRLSIVNAPFRRAFYGFSFEVCERHERGETMPPPRSSSACATPCAVLPKVEHWGSDDPVFAWVSKDSAIRHMTYMAISAGYWLGLRPGGRFWN